MLRATDIEFQYASKSHALASRPVLRGVNLNVAEGSLACILGPNGSGKTTLLRCLLGWNKPCGGSVLLASQPLSSYAPKQLARVMAYVPQFPTSAFAFSVEELVLMGRFAHGGAMGWSAAEDVHIAHAAMEITETSQFADRSLEELSGGEAQRVMIARALAQQPKIMLLDEPTSHLDMGNQLKIHEMMRRLVREEGMAIVCVSHDVNLASRFADQLVLMREGRVVAQGPPEDVVTRDILQKVYGIPVDLIETPKCPTPYVVAGLASTAE